MVVPFTLLVTVPALMAAIVGLSAIAGRWSAPWALVALTVLAAYETFLVEPYLSGPEYVLMVALYAWVPLGLFAYTVRKWDPGRWRTFGFGLSRYLVRFVAPLSAGLALLYVALTLEPGFALRFQFEGRPSVTLFAAFFLTTPILVLGSEAVFRGYFIAKLSERISLRSSLFLSALLFTGFAFNPLPLAGLTLPTAGGIVFTSGVTSLLLGLSCGILFYKSGFSLIGPWIFRTGVTWATLLLPISVLNAGWPTLFVFDLLAIAGVITVTYLLVREPSYRGRRYLGDPKTPRRRTLLARARARRESIRTGVAVIAVVAVIALAVPPLTRASSAPVRFLAIASGSMVPTFHVGDLVVVEHVDSAYDIQVGDIVAYNAPYLSPEGPVVHRVIRITYNGLGAVYTIKGDHNPSPDPKPAVFSQIYGKVVADLPGIGYFVLSPELTLAVVAVLMLYTVYRAAAEGAKRPGRRPLLPIRGEWR
jgi:signal peptidase I